MLNYWQDNYSGGLTKLPMVVVGENPGGTYDLAYEAGQPARVTECKLAEAPGNGCCTLPD